MGAFLDKPITTKNTTEGSGNGLKWAASHMQGWRVSMEDACVHKTGLPEAPDFSFFGVFDGHGGSMTSIYSAAKLIDAIVATPEWKMEKTPKNLEEAMRKGSLKLDSEMRELPQVKSGEDHSGTTAVFGMITPTHIIVGNIGDSRSVMCRTGKTIAMSYDHKPTNPSEQSRIEAAGGSVTLSRVNGDLAVSRALGDFSYKLRQDLPPEAQQVSPEPEFQCEPRQEGDQFLILCCDGIWDVMSNEEVNGFYLDRAKENGGNLGKCCEDLLDLCLERKSRDNMTAVCVHLGGAY